MLAKSDQSRELTAIKGDAGQFIKWVCGDWVTRKGAIQVFVKWVYEQTDYFTEYKQINKDISLAN